MLAILFFAWLCTAESGRVGEVEEHVAEETTRTAAFQAGELFAGRFQLVSKLLTEDWPRDFARNFQNAQYMGRGAFGETWVAEDTNKNRERVAIKFFYRENARGIVLLNLKIADPEEKWALDMAGAECDIPRQIIAGAGSEARKARFANCLENNVNAMPYSYLVLEVAGTQNLEEYLRSFARSPRGPSSKTVLRMAKMMLEGLAQMEGRFVHRDIKPGNLMVSTDADGEVNLKYIDFGMSVKEGYTGGVGGTPMFMPPEAWPRVTARSASYSWDLYSVGETLFDIICGQTFHQGVLNKYPQKTLDEVVQNLKMDQKNPYCSRPRVDTYLSDLGGLWSIVAGTLLNTNPAQRGRASDLLKDPVFQSVATPLPQPAPVAPKAPQKAPQKNNQDRLNNYNEQYRQYKQGQQAAQQIAPRQPPQDDFLDKCQKNKEHWFNNKIECCLKARQDPLRDALCDRPCGANVAYEPNQRPKCQCGRGSKFNAQLFCCAPDAYPNKCDYVGPRGTRGREPLPRGQGWVWYK